MIDRLACTAYADIILYICWNSGSGHVGHDGWSLVISPRQNYT